MSYQEKLNAFVDRLANIQSNYDRFALWYYRRYDHNEMRPTKITRLQDCWTTAYTVMDPQITVDEMLVGRAYRPLTDAERAELDNFIALYGHEVFTMQGNAQGFTIDVPLLVGKGVEWIIGQMDQKIATLPDEERDMYKANREGFSSLIRYAHKVSQYVGGVSLNESDPVQKKLQQTVSKMTWRIPQFASKTFYEAMQAVHFSAFFLTTIPGKVNVVLNGVDQALEPLLDADLKSGRIDLDTAKYIVGCFMAQANFSAFRDQGLTVTLTGGDDNLVTQIFKEVKASLGLAQPVLK